MSCASAQLFAGHEPGVVARVKLDADPCDDILVFTAGSATAYFGSRHPPYLVPGPTSSLIGFSGVALPVVVGRKAFVPILPTHGTSAFVEVYDVQADGRLVQSFVHRIDPNVPTSRVRTLRLAPLGSDFDGDGDEDALAVCGEWPAQPPHAYATCYLAARTRGDTVPIAHVPGQPSTCVVAGLHRARNAVQSADDFMVVVSSTADTRLGGIGFLLLHRGISAPVVDPWTWFPGVPAAESAGYMQHASPSTYGRFQPTPALAVPLLKFKHGLSLLFHPEVLPPFVGRMGTMVRTSKDGFIIDAATADYDGDGSDEVVFVEPTGCRWDWLVVADPGARTPIVQVFAYGPHPGSHCTAHVSTPFHGCSADVNGDGSIDLVLSCLPSHTAGSVFSLLLGTSELDRSRLVRMY
jgi:hypothetical protein